MPRSTQPPAAPSGQQYGQKGAQLASQKVIPIAASPVVGSPTGARGRPRSTTGRETQTGMSPGQIPSLSDGTARPKEPLTAGLPMGPGPGPEALSTAAFGPEELSAMRAIFLQYPNEDIRRLIEWSERTLA